MCIRDRDNIVGIINIKDMLINEVNRVNFDVNKLMREPYYTHEKEELNDLLIAMRNNAVSYTHLDVYKRQPFRWYR